MSPEYDAVVLDLDGTLVHLDVDWGAVTGEVAATLRDRGLDFEEESLWELLLLADDRGHRPAVEAVISAHERDGARTSQRLPAADRLPLDVPVGVCSLNSESACRIALETHGLDGYVDAVVGRDSVPEEKPDPEPLLATVESLDALPSTVLFVGDSDRDRVTAERAGVDYEDVDDWLGGVSE